MVAEAAKIGAAAARRRALAERVRRWCRYHLLIPIKRSRHPPEYLARSVAVGLFWAMTPTMGIQMALVLLHWLAIRRIRRWDFNVVYAMAWTWATNIATFLPVYYVFFVTGQFALGRWDDLAGYGSFVRLYDSTFAGSDGGHVVGTVEVLLTYFDVIVSGWGPALVLGCLPYLIVAPWLGYAWSLKFVVNHRRARFEHRLRRHGGAGRPRGGAGG